ncbi:hypothetical protein Hanom_Chr07g00597701 [Helianthus anomalus]
MVIYVCVCYKSLSKNLNIKYYVDVYSLHSSDRTKKVTDDKIMYQVTCWVF